MAASLVKINGKKIDHSCQLRITAIRLLLYLPLIHHQTKLVAMQSYVENATS